jgi:hypothetical protein
MYGNKTTAKRIIFPFYMEKMLLVLESDPKVMQPKGVKGQSVSLVSLKQFITHKNIFKKQLTR